MIMLKKIAAGLALLALTSSAALAQAKTWTKVTIATEGAYAPWNFTEAGGKLAGFEIDLAQDLCKRMKVECTIIAQDWDGIIPSLTARKYDAIMAGMNITAKRMEVINFSRSYAATPHGFAVLKTGPLAKLPGLGTKFALATEADAAQKVIDEMKTMLKGKVVGVQVSTTNAAFVEKHFKGIVEIKEYKTTEQHDLDLLAGRVDAIFVGQAAALGTAEKPEFKDVVLAGAGFTGDVLGSGVGVGLRKEDPELQKMFNDAITAAVADGSVKALTTKWFKMDAAPAS
jgi:octopine/nopaline transport system substrate-binding protein